MTAKERDRAEALETLAPERALAEAENAAAARFAGEEAGK